jgi:acyl-coenzyme A thioesterase PaaI-like protein
LFHKYEFAELAVNFTESPTQKVVEVDGVIVAVGNALTVTEIAEEVAEQPLVSVTLTE